MADNSQKISYNAGVAKGQAQEKTSAAMDKAGNAAQTAKESVLGAGQKGPQTGGIMDKAGSAAQTAKESVLSAGQTVQASALGAVDAVKNATGMNK